MKPFYLLLPSITGILLLVAGLLLKVLHWPYAHAILYAGIALTLMSAVLILVSAVTKNKTGR